MSRDEKPGDSLLYTASRCRPPHGRWSITKDILMGMGSFHHSGIKVSQKRIPLFINKIALAAAEAEEAETRCTAIGDL